MDIPASDFDEAWKYALDHYFADAIALFFPQVYVGIDTNYRCQLRISSVLSRSSKGGSKRIAVYS